MKKNAGRLMIGLLCGSCCAWADFTVEKTTQLTGGALVGMMRSMGGLVKIAGAGDPLAPMQESTSISGNRMVSVHQHSTTIYDLDKDTVTTIDNMKRLAEMKGAAPADKAGAVPPPAAKGQAPGPVAVAPVIPPPAKAPEPAPPPKVTPPGKA